MVFQEMLNVTRDPNLAQDPEGRDVCATASGTCDGRTHDFCTVSLLSRLSGAETLNVCLPIARNETALGTPGAASSSAAFERALFRVAPLPVSPSPTANSAEIAVGKWRFDVVFDGKADAAGTAMENARVDVSASLVEEDSGDGTAESGNRAQRLRVAFSDAAGPASYVAKAAAGGENHVLSPATGTSIACHELVDLEYRLCIALSPTGDLSAELFVIRSQEGGQALFGGFTRTYSVKLTQAQASSPAPKLIAVAELAVESQEDDASARALGPQLYRETLGADKSCGCGECRRPARRPQARRRWAPAARWTPSARRTTAWAGSATTTTCVSWCPGSRRSRGSCC